MVLDFLDNTCDIVVKNNSRSGGEDVVNEVPVYTGIPCHFFRYLPKLSDTDISSNTTLANTRIILEPDKTLVVIGMLIYLYDPDLGTVGKYAVEGVKMDRFISTGNEEIVLTCKRL